MTLEMKTSCQRCTEDLTNTFSAYICTYECTFCHECTEEMEFVCPNCGGELVKRPKSGKVRGVH
ncbi:DUF1272 domain-containing protein [Metabacillus indicus]|uniref:DUF1272 domain-containing protein n=1 Tax=Metabacillus indicus TaxID=246786 RepID=UPI003983F030